MKKIFIRPDMLWRGFANSWIYRNAKKHYTSFMAQLNLNDIQPGMVLAAPVFNKNGSLLLQKGVVLTEKHVKIFKTWGISEADIEGYDKNKVEEDAYAFLSDEEMKEIESGLEKRFPSTADNNVMKEIFRITKKHKIKAALSTGSETL